jgi:hypothetical protein
MLHRDGELFFFGRLLRHFFEIIKQTVHEAVCHCRFDILHKIKSDCFNDDFSKMTV